MRLDGIHLRILKEHPDMTDCKAEDLANRNLMKFSKEKCRIMYLGQNKPMHLYRLGSSWLSIRPTENDLGTTVDGRLSRIELRALIVSEANHIQVYIRLTAVSR